MFDTKKLTVLDLLMMAGYKSHDIIGRSGRSITFTLNGEKQIVRGTPAIPSELTVNGSPSSIEARVSQGDVIMLKPAENGVNAELTITDIAGDLTPKHITIDEIDYTVGTEVTVGGKPVSGDYKIQNFDNVEVTSVATLGDLLMLLGIEADCSMGSVTITTTEDLDKISFDLSADMGDVTVNGKNQGNKYVR